MIQWLEVVVWDAEREDMDVFRGYGILGLQPELPTSGRLQVGLTCIRFCMPQVPQIPQQYSFANIASLHLITTRAFYDAVTSLALPWEHAITLPLDTKMLRMCTVPQDLHAAT